MYPTKQDRENFNIYRNEWYKRAATFEHGNLPSLLLNCKYMQSRMYYAIRLPINFNSVVGGQRMMPWKIVKKIIDEAAAIGVYSLMFSWRGESTLYHDRDEKGDKIDFGDVLWGQNGNLVYLKLHFNSWTINK